jgi:hypothetical protein
MIGAGQKVSFFRGNSSGPAPLLQDDDELAVRGKESSAQTVQVNLLPSSDLNLWWHIYATVFRDRLIFFAAGRDFFFAGSGTAEGSSFLR